MLAFSSTRTQYISILLLLLIGILLNQYFLPHHPTLYLLLTVICLTLSLIIPSNKKLFIFLSIITIGIWRADNTFPINHQEFQCSGIWQIYDFPKKNFPTGEQISLKLIEGNCPSLNDNFVNATSYQSGHALGQSYQATLLIKAHKTKYYANLLPNATKTFIPLPWTLHYRALIQSKIEQIYPNSAKWVSALLIGNRSQLEHQDKVILKRTGTNHLLAISGLHLGIIIAIFYIITKYIWAYFPYLSKRIEPRTIALFISLLAGIIFVFISGSYPPVIRAWIMFACLLITWLIPYHLGDSLSSLMIAAILILLLEPIAVYELSAWLSFLATAIIILIYQRIKHKMPLIQWVILQLGITPFLTILSWAIFGGISIIAPLINLIIIPWVGLLLLALILGLYIPISATFAENLLTIILNLLSTSAKNSHSYFEPNYQPSLLAAALLYLYGYYLLKRQYRRSYLSLGLASISAITPIFNHQPITLSSSKITIYYPSLGEAIIINTGYTYHSKNQARYQILPALRHRAAKPIAIILTENNLRATTGLKTLLHHYPNTPIYSTIPIPNLPFPYQYCPNTSPIP
ncbi:ComEC/Rec2 family competence protein [Suttonella ornithocola]|nr:ComEC/Rec2 family competence protein [Suttonella ornithocola]